MLHLFAHNDFIANYKKALNTILAISFVIMPII